MWCPYNPRYNNPKILNKNKTTEYLDQPLGIQFNYFKFPFTEPTNKLTKELMEKEESDLTTPDASTSTLFDLSYGDHIHNNPGLHLSGVIPDKKYG